MCPILPTGHPAPFAPGRRAANIARSMRARTHIAVVATAAAAGAWLAAGTATGAEVASGGTVTPSLPSQLTTGRSLTFTFAGRSAKPDPEAARSARSWNFTSVAYSGKAGCPDSSTEYLYTDRDAVLTGNELLDEDGPFTTRRTGVRFTSPGIYRLCNYLTTPGRNADAEQVITRLITVTDGRFVPAGTGRRPAAGTWSSTRFAGTALRNSKVTFTVRGRRVGRVVARDMRLYCTEGAAGTLTVQRRAVIPAFRNPVRGRVTNRRTLAGGASVTLRGVFIRAKVFRGTVHVVTRDGCSGDLTFEARTR